MTERRPPQKKPTPLNKDEDRLAKALRKNLHRRKAQARLRAVAAVGDDLTVSGETALEKSLARDSGNG